MHTEIKKKDSIYINTSRRKKERKKERKKRSYP